MKTKPSTLLAFDPSLHATGWALFVNGNYWGSGVLKVPKKYKGVDAVFRMWAMWESQMPLRDRNTGASVSYRVVVSEIQESRQRNERASVNNLLLLNGVAFGFLAMIDASEKHAYTPQQWKGSTPKTIHNQRVKDYMEGIGHVTDDNELDAIGIGIYHLTGKKL